MKRSLSGLYILLFIFLATSLKSYATHLRAGEITAQRISSTSLTYRITITTYTDEINGQRANDAQTTVDFFPGFINNGVVSYKVPRKDSVALSPSTLKNTYETTVTFPGPGIYKLSCTIPRRNDATINLPQPSGSINWFVQTTLVLNSGFGLNSTPVLLNIPVDSAAVGVRYIHNPGAFDIDGDSLSYKLATPLTDNDNGNGIGVPIAGYRDPTTLGTAPITNEEGTGQAIFRIDARTGDLIWDAPQVLGQYNVAFIVEEWRKAPDGSFIRIGEIERDMQIIVVETDNERPELEVPADFCVEAGDKIDFDVIATDEDTDQRLKLTTFGGVFNEDELGNFKRFVSDSAAVFQVANQNSFSPASGKFLWQTNCLHVREQAYDVLFKVEDQPGRFDTQLADIQTVKIQVNPPKPLGLTGEETEEGISLTWQKYPACGVEGTMKIYRKEGCSGLNPAICEPGMPDSFNYTFLAEVDLYDTTYADLTAELGVIYSYRIVSELALNSFTLMQSSPSAEFCYGSELPKYASVLTKVSVIETDSATGSIDLAWSRPMGLISEEYPGPYAYEIYRAEGLGGDDFTLIYTQPTTLDVAINDTTYTDVNLNTEGVVYKYKVVFYYGDMVKLAESPSASAVKLEGGPDDRKVNLSWSMNTPWSNDNKTHLVLREDKENPGTYYIIAAVNVGSANTYRYEDNGTDNYLADGDQTISLVNDELYCYKVITYGEYANAASAYGELENYSQVYCLSPASKVPPCAPTLTLTNAGCDNLDPKDFCDANTFTNNLSWNFAGQDCRTDIIRYHVYFSRVLDGRYEQIALTDGDQPVYDHRKNNVDGFAGCYYVTAESVLELESERSNVVCADNCENIAFPNVFTPNGDGLNDTFEPMNCPAFVKNVSYEIYNRQGLQVAFIEGNDQLSWDGRSSTGKLLASGTYYYVVKVQFNMLEVNSDIFTYKGYVELLN